MADIFHQRARVAALNRSRPSNDPELLEAKRSLKAANLAKSIEEAVDNAPPITPEQRDRLALLLRPQGGDAA